MLIKYIHFLLIFTCLIPSENSAHKAKYTVLAYVSAVGNLISCCDKNLTQMMRVGSNEQLNLLAHVDTHRAHQPKKTRRYMIHKNKLQQIGPDMCMDSGDVATFIDAIEWAAREFPAEHFIIIVWNHGMGPLDISYSISNMANNPSKRFIINPETKMLELIRHDKSYTRDFSSMPARGICFDATTKNYIKEQEFRQALQSVTTRYLNKKIDLIIFDTCITAALEIAVNIAEFADYMVASQESVPGPGIDYARALLPLTKGGIAIPDFAKHVSQTYQHSYQRITPDYTHSVTDLSLAHLLHENMDKTAQLLTQMLHSQLNNTVTKAVREARMYCTHFDEPDYIDIGHFYQNTLNKLASMQLIKGRDHLIASLRTTLQEGITLLKKAILLNVVGRNLRKATGLSIYFPSEPPIHHSYYEIHFTNNNQWITFLETYLRYLGA